MNDCYTVEELRALGCPNGLIMQYLFISKESIDQMLRRADLTLSREAPKKFTEEPQDE